MRSTGLLPVRYSVLDQWKKICIERFPELADVNLEVGPEAMKMGYPGNRILFKKRCRGASDHRGGPGEGLYRRRHAGELFQRRGQAGDGSDAFAGGSCDVS
ncbi:MAG: hypothetical protein C4345_05045 [Chloroflexota bacterium]